MGYENWRIENNLLGFRERLTQLTYHLLLSACFVLLFPALKLWFKSLNRSIQMII